MMGRSANVNHWEKYDEDGNFQGERCPRCNAVLAQHENRESCGSCGYSKIEK
ncbi:MAG: 30S ribosomal protein S27ae [Candidatus Nanohaloarchaea archaeon]|nr:30S ribosomal protein S27ae [Candidatus Nanohaloarchaea archaeon]